MPPTSERDSTNTGLMLRLLQALFPNVARYTLLSKNTQPQNFIPCWRRPSYRPSVYLAVGVSKATDSCKGKKPRFT
jgi:hypothetical protein